MGVRVLHAGGLKSVCAEVELAARHGEALVAVVIDVRPPTRAYVESLYVHGTARKRRVTERTVVGGLKVARAVERAAVHNHLVPVRRSAAVFADARVTRERKRRAGPDLHDCGLRRGAVDGDRKVGRRDVRAVAEYQMARVGSVGHADARLDRPVARKNRDRLIVGAVVELDVVRRCRRKRSRNRRARRAGVDRDQTARDSGGVDACSIGKSSCLAHAPPERTARHRERCGDGRPVRRRADVRRAAGNRKVQRTGCGCGIDLQRACAHGECSFTRKFSTRDLVRAARDRHRALIRERGGVGERLVAAKVERRTLLHGHGLALYVRVVRGRLEPRARARHGDRGLCARRRPVVEARVGLHLDAVRYVERRCGLCTHHAAFGEDDLSDRHVTVVEVQSAVRGLRHLRRNCERHVVTSRERRVALVCRVRRLAKINAARAGDRGVGRHDHASQLILPDIPILIAFVRDRAASVNARAADLDDAVLQHRAASRIACRGELRVEVDGRAVLDHNARVLVAEGVHRRAVAEFQDAALHRHRFGRGEAAAGDLQRSRALLLDHRRVNLRRAAQRVVFRCVERDRARLHGIRHLNGLERRRVVEENRQVRIERNLRAVAAEALPGEDGFVRRHRLGRRARPHERSALVLALRDRHRHLAVLAEADRARRRRSGRAAELDGKVLGRPCGQFGGGKRIDGTFGHGGREVKLDRRRAARRYGSNRAEERRRVVRRLRDRRNHARARLKRDRERRHLVRRQDNHAAVAHREGAREIVERNIARQVENRVLHRDYARAGNVATHREVRLRRRVARERKRGTGRNGDIAKVVDRRASRRRHHRRTGTRRDERPLRHGRRHREASVPRDSDPAVGVGDRTAVALAEVIGSEIASAGHVHRGSAHGAGAGRVPRADRHRELSAGDVDLHRAFRVTGAVERGRAVALHKAARHVHNGAVVRAEADISVALGDAHESAERRRSARHRHRRVAVLENRILALDLHIAGEHERHRALGEHEGVGARVFRRAGNRCLGDDRVAGVLDVAQVLDGAVPFGNGRLLAFLHDEVTLARIGQRGIDARIHRVGTGVLRHGVRRHERTEVVRRHFGRLHRARRRERSRRLHRGVGGLDPVGRTSGLRDAHLIHVAWEVVLRNTITIRKKRKRSRGRLEQIARIVRCRLQHAVLVKLHLRRRERAVVCDNHMDPCVVVVVKARVLVLRVVCASDHDSVARRAVGGKLKSSGVRPYALACDHPLIARL